MKIGVPREIFEGERRVATTPDVADPTAKTRIRRRGPVRRGRSAANYSDAAYEAAGCEIVSSADLWVSADIVMKVRGPDDNEAKMLRSGQMLISFIWPAQNPDMLMKDLTDRGVTALAMDSIPRISRAQKMDALSSMANIGGYRAVVEAAQHFGRFFTGQITAAGKVPPGQGAGHRRRCRRTGRDRCGEEHGRDRPFVRHASRSQRSRSSRWTPSS